MFDHPLTLAEIKRWLYTKRSSSEPVLFSEISSALEAFSEVETAQGFYFLCGRKDLVAMRQRRQNFNFPRWQKAKKIATRLSRLSIVKLVGVCNTFPINAVRSESDIDFFIIVSAGRLWLARFLVTLLVWLMGKWRHGQKVAGRACLSFYITERDLSLQKIALEDDIYLKYWISLMTPIFSRGDIYERFLAANAWVKINLPADFRQALVPLKKVVARPNKKSPRRLGATMEKILRTMQLRFMKIRKNVQRDDQADSAIIINDDMLKFHEIDRRELFRDRHRAKMKSLGF